jgi:hypothetical protein
MKKLAIVIIILILACKTPTVYSLLHPHVTTETECVPTYWKTKVVIYTDSLYCHYWWVPSVYYSGVDTLLVNDPSCPQLKRAIYFNYRTRSLYTIALNCSTYVLVYERLCYGKKSLNREDVLYPGDGR